jgi:hypothetical protein
VSVVLDDEKVFELAKSGKYSSIVVLSYNQLNLPGFISYSKPTLLINLTKSENDILYDFNDTTRNEIHKTFKNDALNFKSIDAPDQQAYSLYEKFEYAQGRIPVSLNDLIENIFFGAYLNDEIISGIFVMKCFPYLRIRSIFSKRMVIEDKEFYKLVSNATRRVVWEACLWSKKNNYVSLDMASVNINNPKTLSIAKFKMSFGKELTPEYTYIYKTTLFAFFEKFVIFRLFLKRILFKFRHLFK